MKQILLFLIIMFNFVYSSSQNTGSSIGGNIYFSYYFKVLSKNDTFFVDKIRKDLESDQYDFINEECTKMLESLRKSNIDSIDSTKNMVFNLSPYSSVDFREHLRNEKKSVESYLMKLINKRKYNWLEKSNFFNHYINYKCNNLSLEFWFFNPKVYFTGDFYEETKSFLSLIDYCISESGPGYEISRDFNYDPDQDLDDIPILFERSMIDKFEQKINSNTNKIGEFYKNEMELFLFLLKVSKDNDSYLAMYYTD